MGGSDQTTKTGQRGVVESAPVVVIAESDPAIRHSLRFLLEIDGYTVREHASSVSVLKDREIGSAACLLAELDLAGSSGLELAATLRQRAPDLPVVLMTQQINERVQTIADQKSYQLVEKPLFGEALSQAIKAAVASA